MNTKKFSEAMSEVDDKYYVEAANYQPKRKRNSWIKWGAVAACLCLIISAAIYLPTTQPSTPQVNEQDGAPQVVINGLVYLVSPHLTPISEDCPDGFSLAGTVTSGKYESCEYYLNPDVPEWVYVRHDVATNGTIDSETGAVVSTAVHKAFVRYVNENIRGKDFVCYGGQLFISMWSAEYWNDAPDITRERYDSIEKEYGIRIDADSVDGFEFAGVAAFSGDDTVPAGELSSNVGSVGIYANDEIADVLLVETSWHTNTSDESGDTLHTGFNVYVKYEKDLDIQLP